MNGEGVLRHEYPRLRISRSRTARARARYPGHGGIISVQVLNEFIHVAYKKRRRPWPDIETVISVIRMQFPEVISITAGTHQSALVIARDHNFGFYDALIVASALEAGCDTLYSEDMQDGRSFPGLTIVNPFAR